MIANIEKFNNTCPQILNVTLILHLTYNYVYFYSPCPVISRQKYICYLDGWTDYLCKMRKITHISKSGLRTNT